MFAALINLAVTPYRDLVVGSEFPTTRPLSGDFACDCNGDVSPTESNLRCRITVVETFERVWSQHSARHHVDLRRRAAFELAARI